jgi:ribose-phosphate pyrophosphokinase
MSAQALKIFAGNSNLRLAEEICTRIDQPLGQATVTSFPDGETFVRINENIRGADVFIIQSSSPPANHHIMELLIMIDAARRASASRITAVIPFYGYARQDRKDQPRVPITSKLVANLLVAAGTNRVLTMDLHAQQIQGFFDIPVDHLYASPVIFDHLKGISKENLTIFSPDVGGMKMASAYADFLQCPLGFVAKRRTNATTVHATNLVGEVEGRDVLLIDDMTETAGTLIAAAKLIKSNGAKSVRACVSHAVLNETAYERLSGGEIDELITTNSVTVDPRNLPITVVSVADLLAEAIKRIHFNTSVTSLFQVKGF